MNFKLKYILATLVSLLGWGSCFFSDLNAGDRVGLLLSGSIVVLAFATLVYDLYNS